MEQLRPQLDNLGITFERHSALDGKEVDISPILAGNLSHQEVLKSIKPGEMVLILEDDALFTDDFLEKFDEYMAELPSDWDIFYLGALKNQTIPVNNHWVRQVVSTGTQAYCVHPNKVDFFIKAAQDFDQWIDVAYRLVADKCNAYIAQPDLVIQFPSFSDLRGENVSDFNGFR
jgi:GR25 family glycosyltransferase involved in LPS biosynthesis